VRVARDIAGVVLNIDKIERIDLNPIGGADTLTINNLSNTAAGEINVKLTLDGGPGNDQILGSAGNDVLDGGEGYDIVIGGPGTDVGLNGEEVYEIP
jgi:Ca2+-binding RTX toxin-like protein